MEKTLVWHQGALGDLILSLPALYSIRSDGRAAHLHLISRTDVAGIIFENSLADDVSSVEDGLFADFFVSALSKRAEEFLRGFRNAFVFIKSHDETFAGNLRRYIPECFFIGTAPPEGQTVHVSSAQMRQLAKCGIHEKETPFLQVKHFISGAHRDRAIITIHAGSGGKRKCWPLGKFLELLKLLDKAKRFYFYFILGPAEPRELYETACRFISANSIDAAIIADKPVSYIAGLLKASSLYIGNDSGITHLSAALGTRTIAVFGPTDPRIWGPSGSHSKIIIADCPCAPCPEADRKQCADLRCLEAVGVEEVHMAAEKIVNSRA